MNADDRYREWDAAYVIGSLSPAERREYEQHLSGCAECAAAVGSLAGLAGPLAAVSREQAFALLDDGAPATPSVLPALLQQAQRERRRGRWRTAAVAVAAAAAAAVVALAVPWANLGSDDLVPMRQTVESPITAEARLVEGARGTRIDAVCRYAERPGGHTKPYAYAMYVTSKDGVQTQVATWFAAAGSEIEFSAVTKLPRDEIATVDIRTDGKRKIVLLTTTP